MNDDENDLGENLRSGREAAEEFGFPISLPPYNKMPSATVEKYGSCLLYLESLTVFVFNSDKKPNLAKAIVNGSEKNKFSFDDSYVSCLKNNSNDRDFSYVFSRVSFLFDSTFFQVSYQCESGRSCKGEE